MASVGDLLRRLHLQAWELSRPPATPSTEARLHGQLQFPGSGRGLGLPSPLTAAPPPRPGRRARPQTAAWQPRAGPPAQPRCPQPDNRGDRRHSRQPRNGHRPGWHCVQRQTSRQCSGRTPCRRPGHPRRRAGSRTPRRRRAHEPVSRSHRNGGHAPPSCTNQPTGPPGPHRFFLARRHSRGPSNSGPDRPPRCSAVRLRSPATSCRAPPPTSP